MTKLLHTPRRKSALQKISLPHDKPNGKNDMLHERAVLCSRLARLLIASLGALDWQALRFSDRSRLARALTRLASDAHLTELAAGGKTGQQTEKCTLPCSVE